MTFLEKAKEICKEKGETFDEKEIIKKCPKECGLENESECMRIGECACIECWNREMPLKCPNSTRMMNREMPNTDKSILLYIGENYESSVVKKIKEQEEKMVKDIVNECLNNVEPQFSNPVIEKAYNTGKLDGRNETWEFVKIIYDMKCDEIEKIFGVSGGFWEVIRDYSQEEALAKLKAYEEQRKIVRGDVIKTINGECEYLVTRIEWSGRRILHVMNLNNGTVQTMTCDVKKTGKHIDIKSILESIGE